MHHLDVLITVDYIYIYIYIYIYMCFTYFANMTIPGKQIATVVYRIIMIAVFQINVYAPFGCVNYR